MLLKVSNSSWGGGGGGGGALLSDLCYYFQVEHYQEALGHAPWGWQQWHW